MMHTGFLYPEVSRLPMFYLAQLMQSVQLLSAC